MICPWCGYENLSRARFCGHCGRGLELDAVCAECSTPNPADHRFCDACGAPLDASATPVALAGEPTGELDTPQLTGDTARTLARRLRPSTGWARHLRLPSPGLAWEEPPTQWSWSQALAWMSRNRLELAAVVVLTVLAAFVRLYRLAEVPEGLHGDEAWTGLDAMRILKDGWIGPWSGSALGQPSGASYFASLVFGLSDPTLFTLRLSMALLGVATVPISYVLFRIGFGRWVALFAAIALTFSFWHVFYSRVALPVIAMPLATTMASAAILAALRSSTRWSWVLAGALLGLGIYTYTGYVVFPVTIAVFIALVLMLGRDKLRYYAGRASYPRRGLLHSSSPDDCRRLLRSGLPLSALSDFDRRYPVRVPGLRVSRD